jgi:enoyl-CoA hydratase/3-hydroxyacyl-CoA dehydrogenase
MAVCCDGCRLADLVGMGVSTAVGAQFVNAFPERVYVSRLFPLLMEAQRFGE